MPVRTRPIATDYATAHKVRALTGIGTYALLRMVSSGLVRVQVVPGLYPMYCMADVRKHMDTRLGQHKPTAKTRKMVKT
jgi:hypothetical protein